jgi:hypothetical protein
VQLRVQRQSFPNSQVTKELWVLLDVRKRDGWFFVFVSSEKSSQHRFQSMAIVGSSAPFIAVKVRAAVRYVACEWIASF